VSRFHIAVIAFVVLGLVAAIALIGPSGDARSTKRHASPGVIETYTGQAVEVEGYNPTGSTRSVTVTLKGAFGFSGATTKTFSVGPHSLNGASFSCVGSVGCISAPETFADSRVVMDVLYYPQSLSTTPDQETLGWGQWKFT
jgi:hypothetical protein